MADEFKEFENSAPTLSFGAAAEEPAPAPAAAAAQEAPVSPIEAMARR